MSWPDAVVSVVFFIVIGAITIYLAKRSYDE